MLTCSTAGWVVICSVEVVIYVLVDVIRNRVCLYSFDRFYMKVDGSGCVNVHYNRMGVHTGSDM